jgi:hypothetical protein
MGIISRIWKVTYKWFRANDLLTSKAFEEFHYDDDVKRKTIISGLVSTLVLGYVMFIAYTKGTQMITLDQPILTFYE